MKKIVCFLMLINLLTISSYAQKNTISIKKKVPVNLKKDIVGLYYSPFVIEEVEIHNRGTSHRQIRHYVYFISSNEVYIFKSKLSPQKISKKLNKKGTSLADEFGTYSRSEQDLYLEVKTIGSGYVKTYRYVAKMVNGKIYLSYKAAYKEKTALDIYLYKYETPVDI